MSYTAQVELKSEECKPLAATHPLASTDRLSGSPLCFVAVGGHREQVRAAHVRCGQGLTLVHFPAQRKRFLWDRGCVQGLFRGCSGGGGYYGVFTSRVYFVSETAQVELESGRV